MHLTVASENLRRLSVLAGWSPTALAEFERLVELKVGHVRARRAIREAFESAKHVTDTDAADVLEALLPLLVQYVGDRKSPGEVAEAVVAAIRRESARTTLLGEEELTELGRRLVRILASESLLLKAKATELVYERGRVLNKVRIVSDLRPVFGSKGATAVDALTVIHTLVLTYMEDQDRKKLHVALNTADLEELKHVVERALEKQGALDELVKSTSIRKIDIS